MKISHEAAAAVRMVVLDVDGVLTDGGVYIGSGPDGATIELKRFDIQDGLGVKMMMWAGIDVVIVSGRVSEATAVRARELGIDEVVQDPGAAKLPAVIELMERRSLEWSQLAMLGDDLADLPVLRRVGLPATVANAVAEVRRAATWQSRRSGGRGAVREFAEALLHARGEWDDLVDEYCRQRGS